MDRRVQFEAMYVTHCPAVRSFVHRRISPEIADDLVADVFLAAWRRFDQAPEDQLPWLYGIARGVLANARRAQTRRFALYDRLARTGFPQTTVADETAGETPEVLRALASLSERDREILLLVAWEGLSRVEGARVLGIPASRFAVRLHRARRRLEQALDRVQAGDATNTQLVRRSADGTQCP